MIIALDYDETYTRDPVLWNSFIHEAMERGHTVYCVTLRSDRQMDEVNGTVGYIIGHDHCIPCNGNGKRDTMWHKHDLIVDVWIDDSPEFI